MRPLSRLQSWLALSSLCVTCIACAPSGREERLRDVRSSPPVAPLGRTDIEDPQEGYLHSPVGIESGDYYFAKAGVARANKLKPVSLPFGINFFEKPSADRQSYTIGICEFVPSSRSLNALRIPAKTWFCRAYKNESDAKVSYLANNTPLWPADVLLCLNCKPRPGFMDRLCPGYYISWIDGKEWKDPTSPVDLKKFDKSGNCAIKKPWFMLPE